MERIHTRSGYVADVVGFGTYLIPPGDETYRAVTTALEIGYRSIDTAKFYGNEKDVGRAVRDSGLENEVCITTKVWNDDHGYEKALVAGRRSRDKLGVDAIGLLLIHWPGHEDFLETWEALEVLREEGTTNHIGVSNFTPRHLEAIEKSGLPIPVVDQVELSPLFSQEELREYCKTHDIIVEAWRPLVGGDIDALAVLQKIADTHGKSLVQIALRWAVQNGCRVIPKSVQRQRMIENISIFDFSLSTEEMRTVNNLNKNHRTGPDPDVFF